jgi:hypothetical protein
MSRKALELSGQRFGRLVVLHRAESRKLKGHIHWGCRCECGKVKTVRGSDLKWGGVRSCGCYKAEAARERLSTIGGLSIKYKAEYSVWRNMLARTMNPDHDSYIYYGGRGIHVCNRWKKSFSNFISDMGTRPGPGYELDRIDSNKGYYPENCRWVTSRENLLNRSSTHWITYKGQTLCVMDWSLAAAIPHKTLHFRLASGWSIERALETPVRPYIRRTPLNEIS